MNESETRLELIDPALRAAGWGIVIGSKIKCEFFTKGKLIGGGKRDKAEKADYVLQYKNRNLAVIEAKHNRKYHTEGVAQAKKYAQKLQIRFTYSTNGKKIYAIDMITGEEKEVETFPSPEQLWIMTFGETHNALLEKLVALPYETKNGTKTPRYYQDNAIVKTLEALTGGKKRILLTLATGAGKTAIAFQIAWKLFSVRWNTHEVGKRSPRILFLADRNILANQAFSSFNEYGAFSEDALVRINPLDIRKKGKVPTNGNIFFTIFQTFMSGENDTPYFGDYAPDFFDFIIIDECHRGGANDESNWRVIMDYFNPAVQLGLTATPKRETNADTYKYFGEPVYTYALKDGINDGFLTPFRVKQIESNIDDYTYTLEDKVEEGEIQIEKTYTEAEINKKIQIMEREKFRVKTFMEQINQNEKTLVFCATQLHALVVCDLINQTVKNKNPNYCQRVTADDGAIGEQHLKDFQNNEKTLPTILTTSQKLSTGVDALEIKNIVLMRPVNSMIEFKQIIGRGTRLFDGKDYFTIYDFVKAYLRFNDDDWDGPPMPPEKPVAPIPKPDDGFPPDNVPDIIEDPITEPEEKNKIIKVVLSGNKVREFQQTTRTLFLDDDGKVITAESFLKKIYGTLPKFFKNEDELRAIWSIPDTRKKLLEALKEKGIGEENLKNLQTLLKAENCDLFDVLSSIAFDTTPLERSARASNAQTRLRSYNRNQQIFLDFVLKQYIAEGVKELDDAKLPSLLELKYNSIKDAKRELGDISAIKNTFIGFQTFLYEKIAV